MWISMMGHVAKGGRGRRHGPSGTSPLFVRLPVEVAEAFDRFATGQGVTKRELIAGLLQEHLREHGCAPQGGPGERRRVTVEEEPPGPPVGRHSFRAYDPPPVLGPAQVAELLEVEENAVAALAEKGELPGRKISEQWRFSREAVLAWLGGDGPTEG